MVTLAEGEAGREVPLSTDAPAAGHWDAGVLPAGRWEAGALSVAGEARRGIARLSCYTLLHAHDISGI